MIRPYKEKSHFGTGLVIYILIFLILTVCGLIFFYDWLDGYEKTRPAHAVEAYTSTLQRDGLSDEVIASLGGIDRNLQTDGEIRDFTKELLSSAVLSRSLAGGSAEEQAYHVRAGGETVGTVYFSAAGEKIFTHPSWVPVREEYDFSPWLETVSVTVPEDYTVSVNGVVLDASYRTESGVRYQTLRDYYSEYSSLPTMVTYTSGSILGRPVTAVTDASGTAVPAEEMTEAAFLDTCTASDRSRLSAFVREFTSNYVQFTADVGGSHYLYYNLVREVIVPGSSLITRMDQALGSFGFTTTRSCDIIEDSVNICCPFGRNVYFVDYSYTTETVGSGQAVEDSRNIRLVAEDSSGQLLVREMTYY